MTRSPYLDKSLQGGIGHVSNLYNMKQEKKTNNTSCMTEFDILYIKISLGVGIYAKMQTNNES